MYTNKIKFNTLFGLVYATSLYSKILQIADVLISLYSISRTGNKMSASTTYHRTNNFFFVKI